MSGTGTRTRSHVASAVALAGGLARFGVLDAVLDHCELGPASLGDPGGAAPDPPTMAAPRSSCAIEVAICDLKVPAASWDVRAQRRDHSS
jgi:hypothetical protein